MIDAIVARADGIPLYLEEADKNHPGAGHSPASGGDPGDAGRLGLVILRHAIGD
jgi:hypothetical protein